MLRRLHGDERGVAMVVAIMVSFVVLLLSIFVVQLSIHNSTQSAYDRKRITSVAAAEAGINAFWATVQSTAPQSLPCATPLTGTLGSSPGTATYSTQPTYYDASGATLACPLSQTNVPAAMLLTSTGTTNGDVARKVQAYATLSPTLTGLAAAILTTSATSFTNAFTLYGNGGNNADVYIDDGNLSISNLPAIYGNVYVSNGSYDQANNSRIYGDVWANGSVSVANPAYITGDATSSTSSLSGSGAIGGNARAGTTIAGTLNISGSKSPDSPQGAPPTQAFPLVCWTASGACTGQSASWTGYTVQTFADCIAAHDYLTGGTTISGDVVVRIITTPPCTLSISQGEAVNFTGNLAIFTDGAVTMANLNNWNNLGATGKNLYFIVNYRTGLVCGTYPGPYDITTGNNSNFNNVNVSLYSPCGIRVANLNTFSGQIIGATVQITNNCTINFRPVLIPGAGQIAGFQQSIVYVREVA
jgi:hypothetical protein